MDVKVSKSDIIWSYIAQFFNMGAGFITLPLILHMLSTEEIAMNYLMLTVGSMVALLDFGFAPQFGRNVTYVFSGAKSLEKQGLTSDVGREINIHLLKCLIDVAKKVYLYLSLIVLIIMMTVGTWYIYTVTNGFSSVKHSFVIWIIYSISVFFNIYFYYYSSLLTGRGLVKEQKMAMMLSKIVYILLTFLLLLFDFGLIGVCLANLISPFVSRWLSYRYFYDKSLKNSLDEEKSSPDEIKQLFSVIWYNAKKLGINFIGSYAIVKFSLFIVGLYLSMEDISSYGLMMQITGIIAAISTTFYTSLIPNITSLRVGNNSTRLINKFAWAINVFYVIFIALSLVTLAIGPICLDLIGSNASLPSSLILSIYLLINLLENNHSQFATFITLGNDVPFVKAALIAGSTICILDYVVLQFTSLGLLGVVLVQGFVQLCYNNWYWPRWVCKELGISYQHFLLTGISETTIRIKKLCKKK